MTKSKLTRLSGPEFDRLAGKTGMGADARAMARLFLVDGVTMGQASLTYGVSRNRVHLAVERIRREYEEEAGKSGAGVSRTLWVKVDVEMPDRLAVQLAEVMAGLKACKSKQKRTLALSHLEHALAKAQQSIVGGE